MQNSASQKNVKLRNETLSFHKRNVMLHIFFVTRAPLAIPPLVSAEVALTDDNTIEGGRLLAVFW